MVSDLTPQSRCSLRHACTICDLKPHSFLTRHACRGRTVSPEIALHTRAQFQSHHRALHGLLGVSERGSDLIPGSDSAAMMCCWLWTTSRPEPASVESHGLWRRRQCFAARVEADQNRPLLKLLLILALGVSPCTGVWNARCLDPHVMLSLPKAAGFGLGCWAAGEALLRPLLPGLPPAGALMSSKTFATCASSQVRRCLLLYYKGKPLQKDPVICGLASFSTC